ncbi:hypothetical protein IRZ71_20455 [Flavobacterium sp. ANB]|jgi:hypothetical protein|uniref:hypothetical protein n=1 Tax=unclassified Flavobacterium TaxID=196869 RepID=UPI0012B72418|nr:MULTISPECIES: hypothetical protein [unclassified Flavobacterium]MBF4518734.1 hypothetical protein [Flavobacterium sp. ANB]MTD67735.1 hypothetical protein [Flavobacterium sp. LC2016-13]
METNENKKADDFIKELKGSFYFRTLTPQRGKDGIYHADIKFTSYINLIFTVQNLMKIALHALENSDLENSSQIEDPAFHLTSILEIAIQLLPCCEAEGLDKLHKLYLEINQENKNEQMDN